MGVEPFIIHGGEHGAAFIVCPHPIQKGLSHLVGLLHGGGGEFLIHHHDGFIKIIVLAAFLLHLDRPVGEQRFQNFGRRIFRNAPDIRVGRVVIHGHLGFPPAQNRHVGDGLLPPAPVNAFFNEVGEHFSGHPGGAEFDAYVHGLNFGRHGGGERLHIGAVLRIFLCRRLRNVQFSPHIAR